MPSMEYPGELLSVQLSESAAAICLTSFKGLSVVQTLGSALGFLSSSTRVPLIYTAEVNEIAQKDLLESCIYNTPGNEPANLLVR